MAEGGADAFGRGGLALFDTALGACGIAWGDGGILALQLPEADRGRTLACLRRRFPGWAEAEPPAPVAAVTREVAALLAGAKVDLSRAPLDLARVGAWDRAVYAEALTIGPGSTRTYGEIAKRLDAPDRSVAVGQALARNPWPIIVPCHRVTAADGKLGGFSGPGGVATKRRLLAIEAAHAEPLPLLAARP